MQYVTPAVLTPARPSLSGVRPRPIRLRQRAFWLTQLLVAFAATVVYGYDALLGGGVLGGGLHDIPIVVVLAPVTYAAVSFGLEGAIFTSLWCSAVIAPHSIWFARDDYEWLGDAAMLGVIAVTGAFLAFRVERERAARRRAELTSERLQFLSELSGVFDRTVSARELLQELIDRLRANLDLDFAWADYRPVGRDDEATLVTSGDLLEFGIGIQETRVSAVETMAGTRGSWTVVEDGHVVALAVEGRLMGTVGTIRRSRPLDKDGRDTLMAAVGQASVSLENHHLQLARREILTSYARQVTNAQEEERRRIARELHDGPVQVLTGLCRGLDLVQVEFEGHGDAANTARTLRTVAEQAVADLRRLARDLRPRILDDLGLLSAIEWLAEDLRQRTTLTVTFASSGTLGNLSGEQELGAFRIVQEALSNTEKHARASTVEIQLDSSADGLRISVRDDGTGLDGNLDGRALARSGRYGVLGMQERARLNGGRLEVASKAGVGTGITLDLPWDDAG